jgi:hypothetical protein
VEAEVPEDFILPVITFPAVGFAWIFSLVQDEKINPHTITEKAVNIKRFFMIKKIKGY